jgi:hypothetical protein
VDEKSLLQSVFAALANGKKVATVKDLCNWDFILELLGEV